MGHGQFFLLLVTFESYDGQASGIQQNGLKATKGSLKAIKGVGAQGSIISPAATRPGLQLLEEVVALSSTR
jgi:hypothetical protein